MKHSFSMKPTSVIFILAVVFSSTINAFSEPGSAAGTYTATNKKPLIAIPAFQNRTKDVESRIRPGVYHERDVNVGHDFNSERSNKDDKTTYSESSRDVYEKQMEVDREFAPGAWPIPDKAGEIAADETAGALVNSGRFKILARDTFSANSIEDEFYRNELRGSDGMVRICRELGADYLLLGSISGFRINEKHGKAYGVDLGRINTRVSLDVKVIDVNTTEIIYQSSSEKSIGIRVSDNFSTTEHYDYEPILREAIRQSSEELIENLASRTGASIQGLNKVSITVDSNPQGADVVIDGMFVGNTPCSIQTEQGPHEMTIEMMGYNSWQRMISASEGMVIKPTLSKYKEQPVGPVESIDKN